MRRNPALGAWCGYVAIAPSHPWSTRHHDSIPVDVHGGLTYASCGHPQGHAHTPLWWIGFDCAHHGDLIPQTANIMAEQGLPVSVLGGVYRDRAYVAAQVESLAEQVIAVRKGARRA